MTIARRTGSRCRTAASIVIAAAAALFLLPPTPVIAQDQYRGLNAQRCPVVDCGGGNRHSHDNDDDSRSQPQAQDSSQRARIQEPDPEEELARARREQAQIDRIGDRVARLSASIKVERGASTIELVPTGARLLLDSPTAAPGLVGRVMVAPLAGFTAASPVPDDDMRRAAGILKPVIMALRAGPGNTMSEEDMSFLASQAALAMEGAPLSVTLTDAEMGSARDAAETRKVVAQVHDIATAQTARENATRERLRLEKQLVEAQNNLQAGNGDHADLSSRREQLLKAYRRAYISEHEKLDEVRGIATVTVIMITREK